MTKKNHLLLCIIGLMFSLSNLAFMGVDGQAFPYSTTLDLAWSPDGSKLAVGKTEGLEVIDVNNSQPLVGFQTPSTPVFGVGWSPDGSQLASSGSDGLIYVWNMSTGQIQATLSGHETRVTSLSWSPDGSKLASTSASIYESFSLRTWDMTSFSPMAMFDASYLAEVIWTPDSSHLIVANTIRGAYIFDSDLSMSSSQGITQYQIGPDEPISAVAVSPDGQIVALASFSEPVIYLWDITADQMSQILQDHTDSVLELAWDPSNNTIASASLDGTLRIWDVTTGAMVNLLSIGSPLYAVDWSPDGNRLAYGGELPNGQAGSFRIIESPSANADLNQMITDSDSNGSELVTLDGSGSSDPDGAIISYSWVENGLEIASGVNPQVSLGVGVHTIMLTVTDDDGFTDSNEVVITVVALPSTSTFNRTDFQTMEKSIQRCDYRF